MHVVVLENDVDYAKNSFKLIFEMLELFYREGTRLYHVVIQLKFDHETVLSDDDNINF